MPIEAADVSVKAALHPFGDTVLYRLDGRRRWRFFAVVDKLDAKDLRALLTATFTAPPGERRYMTQARARITRADIFYDARAHLVPGFGDGLYQRLCDAATEMRAVLNMDAISVHAVRDLASRAWRGLGFLSASGAEAQAWLCAGAPLPVPSGQDLRAIFSRVDADGASDVQEHLSALQQAVLDGRPIERRWEPMEGRRERLGASSDMPAPVAERWPHGSAQGWGDPPYGDWWTGDDFAFALVTAGVFLRPVGVTLDSLTELRVTLSDEATRRRRVQEAVVHPLDRLAGAAWRLDNQFSIHHTAPTRLGRWCPRDAWDIVERVLRAAGVRERLHRAFLDATEPESLESALKAEPVEAELRDARDRSRAEDAWRQQIHRLRTEDAWLDDVLVGRWIDEFPGDWRSAELVRAVADEVRGSARAQAKTRLHGRIEDAFASRMVGRLALSHDEAIDCYLRIRYGSINPAELLAEDVRLGWLISSRVKTGSANPLWRRRLLLGQRGHR